ncbi:MAG: hypothetical protein L0Z50_13320, partial [Verrucomicrobiales bacterium]|nr:hypothetical protein [Verrucomicrobiales bacterium]
AGESGTVDIENSTLTLAAGTLVRGKSGVITGANSTLINEGKISAYVAGGTIRITVASFTNQGIVEEMNGGNVIAPGFP